MKKPLLSTLFFAGIFISTGAISLSSFLPKDEHVKYSHSKHSQSESCSNICVELQLKCHQKCNSLHPDVTERHLCHDGCDIAQTLLCHQFCVIEPLEKSKEESNKPTG